MNSPARLWRQSHYDVIVLGGGTMGTATAWALAKRNVRALVLEQFHHVHSFGSHGGQTRVFRHAYSEGAEYCPLMRRADDLWCKLGEDLGLDIVHRVGILEVDAPGFRHSHQARECGRSQGIDYEWMNAAEINRLWPAFHLPKSWEGGYSPIGGFLEVEPALKGMAALAKRAGVDFKESIAVTSWGAGNDSVWVATENGRFEADRLIVTAGSWAGEMLSHLRLPLTVVRKTLWWLDVDAPDLYWPNVFPVFATDSALGEIYGLPIFGQPGIKLANHLGGEPVTPQTVDRSTNPTEATDVISLVQLVLRGVSSRILNSLVCLYTRTPDEHFIIDRHPEHGRVAFAAGFSGHGFKFAPVIGEHLADLALHQDTQPIPLFSASRFVTVEA